MRLFSYCIPIDDGAAPNPYWGRCSLAICKPVIRRVAEKGDWVIGVGSKNVNGKDYSGKLVYAMKVTEKMKMKQYDNYCSMMLTEKIPDTKHSEYSRQVGDCIYNFKRGKPVLRDSVHGPGNIETDLGGKYVLLSDHFYYFGGNAIVIPDEFKILVRQGQGHQSTKNEPIKNRFVEWIEAAYEKNRLYGYPQISILFDHSEEEKNFSANIRCKVSQEDEQLHYPDEVLPLSHWHYFLALESDLKEISRFIEIHETNYPTFSIALAKLFLATCSEIDVVLKTICQLLTVKETFGINEYYKVVERDIKTLFAKSANIPTAKIFIKPFEEWKENKAPTWWTGYNKVKHHRNTHYPEANLFNTINALAALYILIYELFRIHRGKEEGAFNSLLIYEHLQPCQELFRLEGEERWRPIAEGKENIFGWRR